MSNIVEKVKEKVEQVLHKDHNNGTTHTGTHTSTTTHTGPHSSGVANAADPRVDSDRDHSTNLGAANYGPGAQHNNQQTGVTGTGFGAGTGNGSTNAGPHDSNVLNKLDPRVDSDRDGKGNMGVASYGPGAQNTGSSTGPNFGAGAGIGAGTGNGSTNAGPHDSNFMNKLDPRVDSDRDGKGNMGAASYGPGANNTNSGTTGTYGSSTSYGTTTAGPHDSNLLNKADPRVDSDRDGSANMGAASYGPGAQNTGTFEGAKHTGFNADQGAGPHSSNLANKLDPRVDSDRDGSTNFGAAQTGPGAYNNTSTTY